MGRLSTTECTYLPTLLSYPTYLIHAPLQVILLFNDSGRQSRTSRTGEGDCNVPAKVLQTVTTGR